MGSKQKSDWDDQDEAFFGSSSVATRANADVARATSRRTPSTSNNVATNLDSNDEELAMKLQQEYLLERAMAEKVARDRDMELARRLQNENGDAGHSSIGDDRGQLSGRRRDFTSRDGQSNASSELNIRRRRQEEEDAAFARSLMEEEGENHPRGGNGADGDGDGNTYSNYPGFRQGTGSTGDSRTTGPSQGQVRLAQRRPSNQLGRMFGSLVPTCAVCGERTLMPLSALGNYYHAECFRCIACHAQIEISQSFTYTVDDNGTKLPMHKHCHAELYGKRCTVCRNNIQSDSNGRIQFIRHPFFETEIMCPKHREDSYRRCTGCSRFEPGGIGGGGGSFADLNDNGRCVCDSCLRTVIVDSEDAKPLWEKVLSFFEHQLKLPVWDDMRQIPILIVGHDALNDQMRNNTGEAHGGSTQIMTRGLCLSEHQCGFNFMLPRMRFDSKLSSFLPSDGQANGHTYFQIPDASTGSNPASTVTAILCLSGLPADLTASILAHEACHAWIKLNPNFHYSKRIPPQVEEGCCQLIAMLFLNDGLERASREGSGNGPSDEKLRQFFKFSIESDTNEVYGEGYRLAARSYAKIGLEALLSHVVNYQTFPSI